MIRASQAREPHRERSESIVLSDDLCGVLEWVAERLDVGGPGDNRLELIFKDGRLVKIYRHESLSATALGERFG